MCSADTIQPFPTFSEIYVAALKALRRRDRERVQGGRRGTADGELREAQLMGSADPDAERRTSSHER